MLSLETAISRILPNVPCMPVESVALIGSAARILRERIASAVNVPGWDNSAMDGYAVRAADLGGATVEQPITLRLIGRAAAGEVFAGTLNGGECVRVFTGSPIPNGADAVVMQEDVVIARKLDDVLPPPEGEGRGEGTVHGEYSAISFHEPVRPGENLRFRGEDIKPGVVLCESGARLDSSRIALLAACGIAEVKVSKKPCIALLATGNELIECGQNLGPGQIYESNRTALAAAIEGIGCEPKVYPLVPDTLEDTRQSLERAFAECDVVITSGGVSVGEMDFVKSAFEASGGQMDFWRVAIKPGKPFVFGKRNGKCLFGLPGNPVSAFVTFQVLVRPALLQMMAAVDLYLPSHPGVLTEPISNGADRRHFHRVKVDASGNVSSAGHQASHLLGSLASANGLIDVPPKTTYLKGQSVTVLRI